MMSCNTKHNDFSGIYKITNTNNNKVYIGQSINVNERLKKHHQTLRGGYHENVYLQNSWNKYDGKNFFFESIEECSRESLLDRENYWMNYYQSYVRNNGYNIIKPKDNIEKIPHTEEYNKRISEGRKLYSDEELLSHLHEVYYMTGKIPDYKSINAGKSDSFHQIYKRRFGTLKKAVVLSGLLTNDQEKKYSRKDVPLEEVVSAFNLFITANKRFPSLQEMVLSNNLYGQSVIFKYFKSIVEFRKYLGFTLEDQKELERKEELIALKEIYDTEGKITVTLVDNSKKTRYSKSIADEYGSMKEAYRQAGIDVDENNRRIAFNRIKNLKQYAS